MPEMPLVTVVLPTYNSEKYVEAQVASIQEQTYTPLQIAIRDDASKDSTIPILEGLASKDPRITLTTNERNLGQTASLQLLMESIDSPLFALSDHDDVWIPEKISLTARALLASSSDLVYSDLTVVDKDLKLVASSALDASRVRPVTGRCPIGILVRNPVYGCTVLGRTSLLARALPFPSGIPFHDRWLALVACLQNGISYLDVPTVQYRQHETNTIGLSSSTASGFRTNVRLFGNGNVRRYLQERLQGRVGYLDGLLTLAPHDERLIYLSKFYQASRTERALQLLQYSQFVRMNAKEVGRPALVFDAIVSLLARDSASESEYAGRPT